MYVTRPISLFRQSPSLLDLPPPEGSLSGYLVIQGKDDGETEENSSFFFFHRRSYTYKRCAGLPFPQNNLLRLVDTEEGLEGDTIEHVNYSFFIPVLGQPLSRNLYYVIQATGKHQGLVCTCFQEDDSQAGCFAMEVKDRNPTRFMQNSKYQQIRVTESRWKRFHGESVTPDGIPPKYFRKTHRWDANAIDLQGVPELTQANGLDAGLRSGMPKFDFPINRRVSVVNVVGEWYCPSIFIHEMGNDLEEEKKRMKESLFYRMSLEQQWEEMASKENDGKHGDTDTVSVNVVVRCEEALLGGVNAVDGMHEEEGMIVFKRKKIGTKKSDRHRFAGVGLNLVIWEKMSQDQGLGCREIKTTVTRTFDCPEREWSKFACYVLVERYVLKRMDGTVVLTCNFRHTEKIWAKWE